MVVYKEFIIVLLVCLGIVAGCFITIPFVDETQKTKEVKYEELFTIEVPEKAEYKKMDINGDMCDCYVAPSKTGFNEIIALSHFDKSTVMSEDNLWKYLEDVKNKRGVSAVDGGLVDRKTKEGLHQAYNCSWKMEMDGCKYSANSFYCNAGKDCQIMLITKRPSVSKWRHLVESFKSIDPRYR